MKRQKGSKRLWNVRPGFWIKASGQGQRLPFQPPWRDMACSCHYGLVSTSIVPNKPVSLLLPKLYPVKPVTGSLRLSGTSSSERSVPTAKLDALSKPFAMVTQSGWSAHGDRP